MLDELTVQNYALIERLTISFSAGLNVLSGETGAGKSILAGALSLLHGARADTSSIRTGTDECVVSATFSVDGNPDADGWLSSRDITADDGAVIIRRTVKRTGRGSIYIQSVPVTRADLAAFSSVLFDLHGQHEHQSLLSEDNHRILLDRFAGLEDETRALTEVFTRMTGLKRKFEKMVASEKERLREIDIMSFAVKEIEDAGLKPGEEEDLINERNILSQHEKLFGLLDTVYEATAENRGGALAKLREARHAMDGIVTVDARVSGAAKRLDDVFFELEDVAEIIRDHRMAMQFDPDRLEECENRLSFIHRLEKKYGATIEDVLAYAADAAEQLASLETWENDRAKLEAEIRDLEADVLRRASVLTAGRKKAAVNLQSAIETILRTLGMPRTTFQIAVEPRVSPVGKPSCGAHGADVIAFRISPNVGEPLKPLSEIASGGEMSRVMLAVKTVLAQSDHIMTLVFDEIDAGIGGEVAVAVGEHLQTLGRSKQVLCITHLASIAARADNHIMVEKAVRDDRTMTDVRRVVDESRVEEIARMLSGDRSGVTPRKHAEELLAKYGVVRRG